ncbi:putative transporter small subunit [Kocuria sp. M1R5S2]
MTPILLTIYVLLWPVLVAGTLAVITRAFLRDGAQARREGRELV